MSELLQFLKSLGAARLAAMIAVAIGLIGVFAIIITRVSAPYMVPLFTDLGLTDSSAIIQELESQAIPYELRADGAVVLVPKDVVLRLRMSLAESGLPSGGSVGYEIFDRGDALGATNFVQNINRLRSLEGELARTIPALQKVVQARVYLVMPERQLFQREQEVPTAPILPLSSAWETTFNEAMIGEGEDRQLAMAPSKLQEFVQAVQAGFENAAKQGEVPVLMTSPGIRCHVRSIVERFRGQTIVMSHAEIHVQAKLKTLGTV